MNTVGAKKRIRRILLVQPKPPAPPWWPEDKSRGVTRPSLATIDPRYPGSWTVGIVTDAGYTFSLVDEAEGLVDALIEDWLEAYEEDADWEFSTQDVVPATI